MVRSLSRTYSRDAFIVVDFCAARSAATALIARAIVAACTVALPAKQENPDDQLGILGFPLLSCYIAVSLGHCGGSAWLGARPGDEVQTLAGPHT